MVIVVLKRLSDKLKYGRERFESGAWRRDGVREDKLGCGERVGFDRRSIESAGGRTAAETIVTTVSRVGKMNFIVTIDGDCSALQLFS